MPASGITSERRIQVSKERLLCRASVELSYANNVEVYWLHWSQRVDLHLDPINSAEMSKEEAIKLGHIASKALELLRNSPSGLSMIQMREMLDADADSQEHFNRRVREIRKYFELNRRVESGVSIYTLGKRRSAPTADSGQVSERLRAAVLHAAHGCCQMCGKTIADDGIKLQADHRIPQSWGGPTTIENLWALCEACNRGKRNYFASFDDKEMEQVVNFDSVHERIARFLKLHMPNPVPAYAIEFVANAKEQQLDWRKRFA